MERYNDHFFGMLKTVLTHQPSLPSHRDIFHYSAVFSTPVFLDESSPTTVTGKRTHLFSFKRARHSDSFSKPGVYSWSNMHQTKSVLHGKSEFSSNRQATSPSKNGAGNIKSAPTLSTIGKKNSSLNSCKGPASPS